MTDCRFPLCNRKSEHDGYCFAHAVHFGIDKPKKQKLPIAKVSEKRKVTNKEYKTIVKEMFAKNNKCQIKQSGCTSIAQGLHHIRKRLPSNITDRNNLIRACNNCNLWVENNPLEAIKLGFSISRFAAIAHREEDLNATIIQPIK